MRRQAAHGVKGHRPAGDGMVALAPAVGPGDGQLDFLVARGDAHLVRQARDGGRRNAGDALGPFRRVGFDAFFEQLEGGHGGRAVGHLEVAQQRRVGTLGVVGHALLAVPVPPGEVGRAQRVDDVALGLAHKHAEVVAGGVLVHQLAGVGVARQKFAVVQALLDEFVDQRQQQGAVGAGLDGDPFVGNGRIAGAHRVDRDKAPATPLELGQLLLHGVGVVVFGGADHHEQLGTLQVGAAELPEGAADGVDHAGGHVDRAKTAVGGVVGGAELARKQAGERLHLVAPGEQGKLLGVGGAQFLQALLQHGKGRVPFDLFKLAVTAIAAGLAQQGFGQPRGRILLHNARGTLGADHALVQRVLRVALDVAHFTIAQMHPDAATAGAHVAGGVARLGGGTGKRRAQRIVDRYDRHAVGAFFTDKVNKQAFRTVLTPWAFTSMQSDPIKNKVSQRVYHRQGWWEVAQMGSIRIILAKAWFSAIHKLPIMFYDHQK